MGGGSGVPQNVITVGAGAGDGTVQETLNNDGPPRKKKFNSNALIGNREGEEYGYSINGNDFLPLNLMSGTVHTGYNKEVKSQFAADVVIANLHHDTVGNYSEIPMQGPFTNSHIGGLQYRHVDINKYDANKSVAVKRITGGSFPTASIQFNSSVLTTKLAAGTGSSVTIRDGDGTTITALYSNVFDLFDNQWTNMDELIFIINNKLDMTTNKISDSILNLTQSVTGNFYNYSIQASSHGFITASGFGGGAPITFSTNTVNIDGPANRAEGWGLVFKDHPSVGDADGAFGFIGADYGSSYPNNLKLKASRYREETAKRPVNIKNIKTTTGSQNAGNYLNEIELFSVSPVHQKTWSRRAYEDSNIEILPLQISQSLPLSTHYQTLIGYSPLTKGNIFGGYDNNRQSDGGLISPAVPAVKATGSFNVTGSPSPGQLATGSFTVTGAHNPGSVSSGSFNYYSTDTQGFQAIADYNNISLQSLTGLQFVLTSSAASNLGIQRYFVTGANSGSSYTNLKNKINAEANLNAVFSEVIPARDRAIAFTGSHNETPNPSLSTTTTVYDQNAYTWVFNLQLTDPANQPHDEYIFTSFENASGKPLSQELFINTSGDLVYRLHFGGGTSRTYTKTGFRTAMDRNPANIVLAHSYSAGSPALGDVKIALNGVDQTLVMTNVGLVGSGISQRVRSNGGLFLFSNKGAANTNWTSTASVAAFFKEDAGTNDRQYLYNQGFFKDYSGVRNISGSLITQWNLNDHSTLLIPSGAIFSAFTGSNMINLTASHRGSGADRIRQIADFGLAEEPFARFSVTSSATGSTMNSTIAPTNINVDGHQYFKTISNMVGGEDQSGLIATNKVTIGPKNFIISSTHTADSDPNFYITYTGSSANIWNALQAKIIANTEVTTINRVDTGAVQSVFNLSSSNGSSGNQAISVTNPISPASFTSAAGMAGGITSGSAGGIQNGHKITYDALGTPKNFIFSYTGQSDSDPNYYVTTTGSSSQIWTALKNKIETVTGDTVNVTTPSPPFASFAITASAVGPAGNKALQSSDSSFSTIRGMLGGTSAISAVINPFDNTIQKPLTNLTGSRKNINTRFSAPGGPEIQSHGYLDAYTSTFSAHNALPFRNLSVLGSGSGESGTIRVEDHLGLRRGLKTLRGLHMGRFGIDSQYGAINATSYPSSGSFNKQHRNNSRIVTDQNFDASIRFHETSTEDFAGLITAESAYDASSFPPTGGKAFSVWVNFSALNATSYFFDAAFDGSNSSISLAWTPSVDRLFLLVHDSSGNIRTMSWDWLPDINRWYHVFITWSGNFADAANFYLNGAIQAHNSPAGASSGLTTRQATKLQIGDKLDAADPRYELQGRLSHFVIYKNNTNNASALYNGGSPLSSGLPDSGDIIDFWLLGNEEELRSKRSAGIGTNIDGATTINSITGSRTPINSTSAELPTIAEGVNYVGVELITEDKNDNAFINSSIPRTELQYSWIHAATTGSDGQGVKYDINHQKIVGYAPRDGILGKKDEFAEAILFPSASSIYSV